jgi:hypothetical protein
MIAELPPRTASRKRRTVSPPSRLDWSVLVSIALMLAMALAVAFGDAGPATAYAAVPM